MSCRIYSIFFIVVISGNFQFNMIFNLYHIAANDSTCYFIFFLSLKAENGFKTSFKRMVKKKRICARDHMFHKG